MFHLDKCIKKFILHFSYVSRLNLDLYAKNILAGPLHSFYVFDFETQEQL